MIVSINLKTFKCDLKFGETYRAKCSFFPFNLSCSIIIIIKLRKSFFQVHFLYGGNPGSRSTQTRLDDFWMLKVCLHNSIYKHLYEKQFLRFEKKNETTL